MPEVTNELIYEALKQLQSRMGNLDVGLREVKQELISIRGHMLSMQNDIHNIYDKLDRHDERLERIERRLEIRELAEPAAPFRPE
ncbi:hypothetical protein E3C22_00520 [Jiella endophytica]|uniref:Uncharacterized protein n=1 Tax=Jiella endophytica TaxID=2558362 RepID=A0A4Y8RRT2_9HYPH|nr:hypothetical protein [Jiella endophytica]TFF20704.1 hypothetical protein E3C22_17560 [Jiella endophytica]TFF27005.1 hypothetical protein E3C22_00520 [Jiella endophytica]